MKKIFLENLPQIKYGNIYRINWKECIGYKINFIYDNIKGNLVIINYYQKNHKPYLKIKYKNKIYDIRTDDFINCDLQKILHNELFPYKYQLEDIITDVHSGKLQILEQIKIKDKKEHNRKGYKYKCLVCGNEDIILEENLDKHRGCNVCCIPSRKILIGYNDMWETNPELAKLLVNPEDGYKYTQNSNKPVDWKCPECGNLIKHKVISSINVRGLSCPKCGDGISYPEKIMYNVLKEFGIDFTYQLTSKKLKWCNKYKYDFYFKINNEEYVLETHGKQHYQKATGYYHETLEEIKQNDELKKGLALQNGIKQENYIVIDCSKSELEWIKKHILSSRLAELFNLNKIDWLECHKFACSSLVKQACDLWNDGIHSTKRISNIIKLSSTTIIKYLKQGTKLNWCNYDSGR